MAPTLTSSQNICAKSKIRSNTEIMAWPGEDALRAVAPWTGALRAHIMNAEVEERRFIISRHLEAA